MTYDTIIVGAGSAGCVLANRLSANPNHRVLLLEAGGRDWHPFIHMPAGIAKMVNRKGINWDYSTEPEAQLDNRRLWWPRGKVLGGSSSINAMCYIRGDARDYDEWARMVGDERWNWNGVLPYFKRAEGNTRGASELHGADGPLAVQDLKYHNALTQAFVDAAQGTGLPLNPDFNGTTQLGAGFYQVTQKDGARCSTAASYLHAARGRANLTVRTRAVTQHVLLDGHRAVGVDYRHNGRLTRAEAREVILCGGAINSPQLLMLSGVGPADHLRAHGIRAAHDLPGVGANLQDHLDICTLQHCTQPVSYDRLNEVAVALEYLLRHDGPGTSNIAEGGAFVRTRLAPDERCDVQLHFIPALLDDHGRHRLPGYGYTLHACNLRPRSRGTIRLKSADPAAKAEIRANYLSDGDGHDLATMIEGAKLSREIFAATAFDAYRGEEIFPGSAVTTDAGLADFIRRKAETVYHPVGSCRMGNDDQAVVDSQLRVRGVAGLRVVDASVMPCLPGGNTNAPTIMIAERAADMIAAA
ncbi:MAG: choline dehydrogenase [Xanthomonadales bacterium PRO7]|jgi:choline dehydrogenase-like flavoprotein|nr:choline dehydrogenase [Xanthomonadales bacterium PRO7]HMM57004.1 choline dehydrogenase [Rudaea sp.]